MTSTSVLTEPAVLRILGRGERHQEAHAALTLGQVRRVLHALELIRRRCSTEVVAETGLAVVIAEWMALAGKGDVDALAMLTDPFVELWATGVLRGQLPIADTHAVARMLGPQLGYESAIVIQLESPEPLVLSRCGGVLCWDGSRSVVVQCIAGKMTVTTDSGTATFVRSGPPVMSGSITWNPIARTRLSWAQYDWAVSVDGSDASARAVGPGGIDGLDADAERRWIETIDASWQLLRDRHQAFVPGIAEFARVLVPQSSPDPMKHVSGSSADGFGAIALSLTSDVPTFAVALVHETQHLKLNALLDVVTLHHADSVPRYYAGWRDDPRPFQALLHGVYAFSAVTEFWRVEYLAQTEPSVRRRYGFEYSLWAAQTSASLRELIDAGVATPEGLHFLAGLEDVAAGWNEVVEKPIVEAVGDVMAEHRLNWQLAVAASPHTIGCGLRRAWRLALTGVDIDPSLGPVGAIDCALVGDDSGIAVELARKGVNSDPSPCNVLRLSRAYAHAGMSAEASEVMAELLESIGVNVQLVKAGCP